MTREYIIKVLDEAGLLMNHVEHAFTEQIKLGNVQVCFDTDANIRKIDDVLTQLSALGIANESIAELLYKVNLQRRANTR